MDLINGRCLTKYVSIDRPGTFYLEILTSIGIMGAQLGALIEPLDTLMLWCSRGFRGILIGPPWCRDTPVSRTAVEVRSLQFFPVSSIYPSRKYAIKKCKIKQMKEFLFVNFRFVNLELVITSLLIELEIWNRSHWKVYTLKFYLLVSYMRVSPITGDRIQRAQWTGFSSDSQESWFP